MRHSHAHKNKSIYIRATHWHRLENVGRVLLEIIEVQIGTFLGRDDIVRAGDAYNRTAEYIEVTMHYVASRFYIGRVIQLLALWSLQQ